MSHNATNWAIEQRGIRPATKIVLWHLCDRHNPDYGCFPEQERLAHDAEMSRSGLNTHLNILEEAGLIRRVRRKSGGRKMKSTKYFFPFEGGREEDYLSKKPCPESGHGTKKTMSRKEQKPCPENGENHVQNLDSNSVREPVREPVTLSGGASENGADAPEREKSENKRVVEQNFKDAWQLYDNRLKSSYQQSLMEWWKLSPEDRKIADRRILGFKKGWVAAGGTPSMLVSFSTYLKDRRFDQVDDPRPVGEPLEDGRQVLSKFGKVWGVKRLARLRQGAVELRVRFDGDGKPIALPDYMRHRGMYPSVHAIDNQPAQRLAPEHSVPQDVLDACQRVEQGSPEWRAWADYHAAMDWPMVTVGDWKNPVWFPALVPSEWSGYVEVVA